MAEFAEVVEEVRQDEASIQNLFNRDEARVRDRRQTPDYMQNLVEATKFVGDIIEGRRPLYHLQEAMSTSDFPILFADVLDRQLLAAYREVEPTFENWARRSTVPNFQNVERVAVDGAESALPEVDELEEYPEGALHEVKDAYKVRKYGRRLDLSWEAMVNDDLDAFRRNPDRLARAARRSESKFAVGLWVDSTGPHASLYDASNTVPSNPILSIPALQAAFTLLSAQVDDDGEPILIEAVELVVPPALEVTARNILNAVSIEMTDQGGTANQKLQASNWMKGRVRLSVEPYIPKVASSANGATMWALFANPNSGRASIEFGKLRGYEDPALYERAPNARRIGGGDVLESFEDDSVAWRVRHVFGGARLTNTGGKKSTVASDGSGAP